jgi:hypothetical protein
LTGGFRLFAEFSEKAIPKACGTRHFPTEKKGFPQGMERYIAEMGREIVSDGGNKEVNGR